MPFKGGAGGSPYELVNASPGASGASKELQDGPKGLEQSTMKVQKSVETAKGSPTTVQDGFETAHEAPKTAHQCSKNTARRAPRSKNRPIPFGKRTFSAKSPFSYSQRPQRTKGPPKSSKDGP